jgi:hypothetical protein
MGEQQEVIAELDAAGVLAGVRWAYESAVRRALETYSEADGHDVAWLGNTRFTLLRDRLDRVFSCERYATGPGDELELDLDVLYAELSGQDIETMPHLASGVVCRRDLHGSPGWSHKDRRFLLASAEPGRLDVLPWPSKSLTKRLVALQRSPEVRQPSLFEGFEPDEVGGLAALLDAEANLGLVTYVVGHSLDPFSGNMELVFGRPRLNAGGGQAWYWRADLLAAPVPDSGCRPGAAPVGSDSAQAPDAPVRLRRGRRAGGER